MEVAPGIYRIDDIRGANCYLITDHDKILVIDTGMPGGTGKIIDCVKRLKKNLGDIKYIILTHADIDHIGNAAELKKITGAKLVIHTGDVSILNGKMRARGNRGLTGVIVNFLIRLVPFQPIEPDIILQGDSEIESVKIICTPGHTFGSICIYEPGKVIFTGDALISDSRGNPKPPPKRLLLDIIKTRSSLEKISELDYEILLAGHGAPVIGKASQKVREMMKVKANGSSQNVPVNFHDGLDL